MSIILLGDELKPVKNLLSSDPMQITKFLIVLLFNSYFTLKFWEF